MTRFAPLWLQADSYAASQDRMLIGSLYPGANISGMVVSVASGMNLNVAPGTVTIPTPNNTGTTLCVSDAVEQVTIGAAPASGSNRIDLVVAQARGGDLDGGANNDFVFAVIAGVVATSPVPPVLPPGCVSLAQVYVGGGVAAITAGNLTDTRPVTGLLVPTWITNKNFRPWFTSWGIVAAPAIITANQTGFGTGRVDIAGLQVLFTPTPNRQLRVHMYLPQFLQQTATSTLIFYISDINNNVRQQARFTAQPSGAGSYVNLLFTGNSNSAAGGGYKGQVSNTAGTVDLTLAGTQPAILTVEDVGPIPGANPP